MLYPGHVISIDATGVEVAAIAGRLAALGYADAKGLTRYDKPMAAIVRLFQSQHVDAQNRPLKIDGKVGPLTWGALFGAAAESVVPAGLAGAALGRAISQIGVREQPLGSNRGPEVDGYLAAAKAPLGSYWCMAFVYWCFARAAEDLKIPESFPQTAGCLDAWSKVRASAPARIVTRQQALAQPSLVKPGLVFILDHGGGLGHTGFVREVAGGALRTVEGNSNDDGSANGVGVFDLRRRTVMETDLKGFLDVTG
jgi:hypothetical protein